MVMALWMLLLSVVAGCEVDIDELSIQNDILAVKTKPRVEEYCHKTLGCFSLDGVYRERAVNFLPANRTTIDTKFKLYTTGSPHGHPLNADVISTLHTSTLDTSKPVIFIIHGFVSGLHTEWFKTITKELLTALDSNIIHVGWKALGNSEARYTQATANTRVVAAEIVYLIKTIQKEIGLILENVHLIGHGLGAHVAGYAGDRLQGRIGRISGLDPAGPYFEGFGTRDQSGHADFWPNGGISQPGCSDLFCDHGRAILLYIHSIHNCPFRAISCSDMNAYEQDQCTPQCSIASTCNNMGYHAHRNITFSVPVNYYLHTASDKDFCAEDYHFLTAVSERSEQHTGVIKVKFLSSPEAFVTRISTQKAEFNPGTLYKHLQGIRRVVNISTAVSIEFTPKGDSVSWGCWLFSYCGASVIIDGITVIKNDGERYNLCPKSKELKAGEPVFISICHP